MDVAAWLQGLGLERYAPAFFENRIEADILPSLTLEDLRDLGVTLVGDRRRLLDAIAALGVAISTPAASAPAVTAPAPAPADAERRQLTVMFCDLVGSTALSTRHDPEDLRELIGDYHRAVSETVGRFDGFVAKYMGDGVLIYFGYPQAHEDDAERAVRAGLAVIEAVGRLPAQEELSVRLGVATGLAVVGDLIGAGAAQERGVVGETPNLAARLQSLAAPNTLVIAEATRRQIGGLFDLEDLGAQQLAGFAEPQNAWRVIGESGAVSRFEALRSGETPLVGREEEVELLVRRWQQAKSGEGRVVLISGEPGIGKSRLTAALSEHIGSEPHTRLRYFCSPHHQDSALYPFITQLERAAGFDRDDTVEAKLGKLGALLAPGSRGGDDIELLSELLSLPSSAAELNLSPQRKREKLFEAMLNQLEAEAQHRPVLMVFEDAHWIDPTSRELLDLTVDRVRRLPVLLAITFRPEFQPPWGGRSHVTTLALNRLDEHDGEALVQTLAGNAPLSPQIVTEIVERTDGVPLFVEELTKAVLESAALGDRVAAVLATTSLAARSVPATLHASLMARLDRLGPAAKEIAQIGAVLGREFAHELIVPVAQRPKKELQAALDQLGDAGLLFCRGIAPHASYLFKHALVQDAAYSTLLRGRRQELHARVAAALKTYFTDLVERQPELLAHHLTAAGDTERAIQQWLKAGQRAIRRSANTEGIAHFTRGIEALRTLPPTDAPSRVELDLLLSLGPTLSATHGWSAPEAERAYRDAERLARALGADRERFDATWGLWMIQNTGDAPELARGTTIELFQMAHRLEDPSLQLEAHHAAWASNHTLGDHAATVEHMRQGLSIYNLDEHRGHAFSYGGHDAAVCGKAIGGRSLWALGYLDQAHRSIQAAIALAETLGHGPSLAHALLFASHYHQSRRDAAAARVIAERVITVAEEHRLAPYRLVGGVIRGWAVAHQGLVEDGLTELSCNLATYDPDSPKLFSASCRYALAEVYLKADDTVRALAAVEDALRAGEKSGGKSWLAAILHLKGAILAAASRRQEAERCFFDALQVARVQQAKTLELRAATSLARLWGEQRRRTEARDLLAPVYGWFTEGFDTADLKEAKTLLDQLA